MDNVEDEAVEDATTTVTEKPGIPIGWMLAGIGVLFMLWIMIFIAAYAFTETTNK